MDAVQSSISRRERPVAGQLQTEPTLLCLCKFRHERGDLNSKKQFEHFCTDLAEFMAYREGEVTQYLGRYLWEPNSERNAELHGRRTGPVTDA